MNKETVKEINFDKIKTVYHTSTGIECDSYDEARMAEVLKAAPLLYLSDLNAQTIAKEILKYFDISLKMNEAPLIISGKTKEIPLNASGTTSSTTDDDLPF